MIAHDLIQRAADSGVELHLDGETLKARGARQAVETLSPELRVHKAEIVKLLADARTMTANDPATSVSPGLESAALELLAAPDAWRELAQTYYQHHFKCAVCIAAGRGSSYGLRCGAGAALWTSYQNT